MKSVRLAIPVSTVLLCALAAAPASADVTLTQKTSGKGAVGSMAEGETKTYMKGLKYRFDQTSGNRRTTMLVDAGGSQMILINHEKKEAEVFDTAKTGAQMSELVTVAEIKSSFTPTAQTRQLAGHTCTVYDVSITMPVTIAKMPMTMSMNGPYCLTKSVPGHADYLAFYKAASERGLFFGDPRAAQASPLPRAMTEMYRKMSELGVPLAMDVTIKSQGDGPMAALMARMGGATMITETTAVSADPIADSLFEIPAGYKIQKR
jgi:hypothetical protein